MNRTIRTVSKHTSAWQNAQTCITSTCTQRTLHTSLSFNQSSDSTSSNPPVSVTASNARLSKLGSQLKLLRPDKILASSTERTRKRRPAVDPTVRVTNPLNRARQPADKLDKYDLKVGMIVERLPRFLNPPPSWQVQYENQLIAQRQQRIPPVPAMLVPDVPTETVSEKQLVDIETEHDRNDDRHSLDRVQNDSLYLLVKHSNGQWTLPQQSYDSTKHQELSLETAARTVVTSIMGESLQVYTLGFAPVAMHRNEPSTSTDATGSKLFVYHGVVVSGNVKLVGEYSDYAWITKSQLSEYLKDNSLVKILNDVLINDSDLAKHDLVGQQAWSGQTKQRKAHA